ncbi:luc7-like protein 3 [Acropora palmata]|uniref:luc7-like protein 3 n=1 Tax=Acropora palmata TaxID=6131 RepID=UPI003DA03F48
MSMLSAAALLDELMGVDRNRAPDEKKTALHWSDPQVCKHFLCGFCPSQLFVNTRSDLGPCEKAHDERLRKEYQESSRFKKMRYEDDFLRYLQNIMADVDRRIRRGHARLNLSRAQEEKELASGKPDSEKIMMLTEKINSLLEQVEQLGCEGKVEEAQGVMKLCEQLKSEREMLQMQSRDLNLMSAQEKQMEVCEVCGAFLIIGDAQTRVDDHLQGKQHMGYAKIKSTIEELKKQKNESPSVSRDKDDQEREKKQERERERSLDNDRRDRDRDRERDRDRGRDRDRDKDRERRRDRDRGRDRERDRDRDRKRGRDYDRSRDRDRGRDHDRGRDRDRDNEKDYRRDKGRERDRERDRERSKDKDRQRESNDKRDREKDGEVAEDKGMENEKEGKFEAPEKRDSIGEEKDKSRSRSRSHEKQTGCSSSKTRSRSRSPL